MITSGSSRLMDAYYKACDSEEVPKEWKTTKQLADQEKKSPSRMIAIARLLREKGVLECKEFRIMTGKSIRPVPHYRFKK